MRSFLTCLSLLLAGTAAAASREALREVVHPKADLPAFRCLIPGEWRDSVDAAGNLQLSNPNRSANFALGFAHAPNPPEALDALAKAILTGAVVAPWESREPAEISGHRGFRYVARVKHSNGAELRAEVILVAVNDRHIASCSMILAAKMSREDENLARLVQAAVKLTAATP